jgi:GDP-fucose transporter C1
VILKTKTSTRTLLCLGVVIAGFFVGSSGEMNFSLKGTVFGVTSSLFVALNGIFSKKMLPLVENSKGKLLFYMNVNASMLFVPLMVLTGEITTIQDNLEIFLSLKYWIMMVLSGVLGFFIGVAVLQLIKVTSPLSNNIAGTAKACLQTLLALVFFGNDTTAQALFGVFMVIFGSSAYAYVRKMEQEAEQNTATAADYAPVAAEEPTGDNELELQSTAS